MIRPRPAGRRKPAILGMYIGWGASATLDTFAAAHGLTIRYAHEFGDHTQWTFFETGTNFTTWNTWVGATAGRRFTYSCPLLTVNDDSGLTIAQKYTNLAAGSYNSHFTTLGNAFQAQPNLRNSIVRLGWEMNGIGFPWAVPPSDDTTLANYKTGFNQAAAALKAACPTLEIEWCPNTQLNYTQRTFADLYPGNTNVDYIGIGLYDYYWPANLADPFTLADGGRWLFGAAAAVTGGRLVLTPNSSYTGYATTNGLSTGLINSAAFVEVVQVTSVGNGTTQTILAVESGSLGARWVYSNGSLSAQYNTGSGYSTTVVTLSYVNATHRWWRLSVSGGEVLFDTSTDGSTWTNRATAPVAIDTTTAYTYMMAGYFGTEPSPGTAIFDNFNVTTIPQATREEWLRDNVNGLADQVALARANRKKLCHTEYGLWQPASFGGGGDRPAFIDFLANWYAQYGYAFHVYNNVDTTSGTSGSDHRLDSNPTAEARYVARYGG